MNTTRTYPPRDRLEDAEWLAETGETLQGAVKRLGFRRCDALQRMCERHGRPDIYATLSARQAS